MKKIFVLIAAAFVGASAYAQVGITVGGSVGFTFSSAGKVERAEGEKMSSKVSSGASFKFLPEVGYRLNKQLTVGGTLGYMRGYAALGAFDLSDFKSTANLVLGTASDLALNGKKEGVRLLNTDVNGFRFAPYVRYTLLHSKWVDIFAEGGFGYNLLLLKNTKKGETYTGHLVDLLARPGLAVNLGDKFQITAKFGSLGWQFGAITGTEEVEDGEDIVKVKTTYHANRIGFDFDSANILLGLAYKF